VIYVDDSVIIDEILEHVVVERRRAKLTDKPFDLGIMTDIRPSQVLKLVRSDACMSTLKEIGMAEYKWYDDALRSELRIAGENLLISICSPR
jgi:hypothetical protein